MLSISPAYRYHLYHKATDMRNGFDGLCGLVRNGFCPEGIPSGQDPLSGDVFIFLNKRKNLIKLLAWQGDGFAIFYKRLEKGTYEIPEIHCDSVSVEITCQQLLLINEGIRLSSIKKRVRYQRNVVYK